MAIWFIFAGLSILITAIFIFDDIYYNGTDFDSQHRYSEITLTDNKDKKLCNGNSRNVKDERIVETS